MRRLTIYFLYDPDGIVDEYVVDCVRAMAEHSDKVLVVSNGALQPDSRQRLADLGRVEVAERANEGFDVWAYKYGISLLGWDALRLYDEVIFMNFTIAGPLYPLAEMFEAMDAKSVDFWGINVHSGESYDPWGIIPSGIIRSHLQSHFIAVRQRMLKSGELEEYWTTMRPINRYQESIAFHESTFTDRFASSGFTWESYVDMSDLAGITSYPLLFMPREVLINRRCPFFKRKALFLAPSELAREHVASTQGRVTGTTIECVRELGYDLGKILPNVIRTNNQHDLRLALDTTRVLRPSRSERGGDQPAVRVVARVHNLETGVALQSHAEVLAQCREFVALIDGDQQQDIAARLDGRTSSTVSSATFADFIGEANRLARSGDYLLMAGFSGDFERHAPVVEYSFYEAALAGIVGSVGLLNAAVDALSRGDGIGALAPIVPAILPEPPEDTWARCREAVRQILGSLDISVPISDKKPAWGSPTGIVLLPPNFLLDSEWDCIGHHLAEIDPVEGSCIFDSLVPLIAQARGQLLGFAVSESAEASTLQTLQYLLSTTYQREREREVRLLFGLENLIKDGIDPVRWFGVTTPD